MTVFVGTSGWQYKSWKATVYPADLPQSQWLEYYARRFRVVEVNNTFYRLPPATTFASWARRTPDDFVFVVKVSRYLTHIKRLLEPEQAVQRLLTSADPLGDKLGPLLVQLPATFKADPGRLARALGAFPKRCRIAVEFRHESWFTDEVRDILGERDAALCWADRQSRSLVPLWRTASWVYHRMHEGIATPRPCYGRQALATWAQRLVELAPEPSESFVFFNNDPGGCAVRDAVRFAHAAEAAGLDPTRVPSRMTVNG